MARILSPAPIRVGAISATHSPSHDELIAVCNTSPSPPLTPRSKWIHHRAKTHHPDTPSPCFKPEPPRHEAKRNRLASFSHLLLEKNNPSPECNTRPPCGQHRSKKQTKSSFDSPQTRKLCYYSRLCGEVAEWSIVPDSKSGVLQGTEGSNPSLSARTPAKKRLSGRFFHFLHHKAQSVVGLFSLVRPNRRQQALPEPAKTPSSDNSAVLTRRIVSAHIAR